MIGAALLLLAAAPQAREPLRDPMRPRVTGATGAATAPQRLQLHGVLIRADDSLALVNERVVRAGDQIGAWQNLRHAPPGSAPHRTDPRHGPRAR